MGKELMPDKKDIKIEKIEIIGFLILFKKLLIF
jgi:hypothetical protein